MEGRKAAKRPFDLNAVLDDSLKFENWNSDSDPSHSPGKRSRLSDDESDPSHSPGKRPRLSDDGGGHTTVQENGGQPDSQQTLQYHHSDHSPSATLQYHHSHSPSATGSCDAESVLNGEDKATEEHEVTESCGHKVNSGDEATEEHKVVTGSLGHRVNGGMDDPLDVEVINEVSGKADDSSDTVIVSYEEHADVETRDPNLSRTPTVDQNVALTNAVPQPGSGTAQYPTMQKGTSLETDADVITAIIPDADRSAVMASLDQHWGDPDRVNIVLTTLLDRTSVEATGPSPGPHPGPTQGTGTTHSGEGQSDAARHTHHNQPRDGHQSHQTENKVAIHSGDSQTPSTSDVGDRAKHSHSHQPVEKQSMVVEGGGDDNAVNVPLRAEEAKAADDCSLLYRDCKDVTVRVRELNPQVSVNATEVYLLLQQHAGQAHRVDLVCTALLKKHGVGSTQSQASSSDDIFNQAIKLNSEFPQVDPSEIYELLEKEDDKNNALQRVQEKLQAQAGSKADPASSSAGEAATRPAVPKEDSVSNDPLVRNDPVFRDMRIVSRMFPEKDQNELYALLEAHYYRPDRVQLVIEELLNMERGSQDHPHPPPASPHPHPPPPSPHHPPASTHPLPAEGQPATPATPAEDMAEYLLQAEVDHLRDVFPDCDPIFILERLEAHKATPDRVKVIAAEMFETKNYPRLKDTQEKRSKAAQKRRLQDLKITMEEFLAKFPDPSAAFAGTERETTENYRRHLDIQLQHDFPDFHGHYVKRVVDSHQHHLLPIVRELENTRALILANGGQSKKLRDDPKDVPLEYPPEPDEYFFYELWFSLNQERVTEHFEQKGALRQVRVEQARAGSELYECQCCFEDECLFEDMNTCADGHLFCRTCIARSAESAFGEGRTQFPCLTGTCQHQIPLSVLKEVLPAAMFSKVLRKMQEEEVRQAGIADLVECPFCPFATIMPDPDDKVFTCLNPQCLKDSCRLCREPNHVPLRCEEVEKEKETDMRTFIEKRVTAAMLRQCHACGKHFVKDAGCNKMTCVCGATSCYVCRAHDIGYDHFTGQNCTQADMNVLHKEEMETAAREAREEYLRLHPEAEGMELKHDPTQHIQQHTANPDHRRDYGIFGHILNVFGGGDSDDSDSDDSATSEEDDSYDSLEEEDLSDDEAEGGIEIHWND